MGCAPTGVGAAIEESNTGKVATVEGQVVAAVGQIDRSSDAGSTVDGCVRVPRITGNRGAGDRTDGRSGIQRNVGRSLCNRRGANAKVTDPYRGNRCKLV